MNKFRKIDGKKALKRTICLICAICVVLSAFLSARASEKTGEVQYETVQITEGTLISEMRTNVRQGPGTEHPVILEMRPGEVCIITGETDGWYSIEYGEISGYITKEYIKARTYETQMPMPTATPAPTAEPTAMPGYRLEMVTIGRVLPNIEVNVRRGPGKEYETLLRLRPGDECLLIEDEGNSDETVGWYHIDADGQKGYVAKELMEIRTELVQIPLETPTPELTATPEPTPELTAMPGYRLAEVIVGTVVSELNMNVRQGPGKEYDVILQLASGDECILVEDACNEDESISWYHIEVSGIEGYIAKEYVQTRTELRQIPQETPTPEPTATPEPTQTPEPEATGTPTPVPTERPAAEPGYEWTQVTIGTLIAQTKANIREGAGTEHDIVGHMDPGDICTVLGEENGWYRIMHGTYVGYVSKDLIETSVRETQTPIATATPEPTETPVPKETAAPGHELRERLVGTVIAEGNAGIRSGAGTEYEIITYIAPGKTCFVLDDDMEWYEIQYGGYRGFIAKEYLAVEKKVTQVPLITPSPVPTAEPVVTEAPTAIPDINDLPTAMPGYEWVERTEGVLNANYKTNVRRGPGTDYDIATHMNPGDVCRVLSEENGWYRVEFGGVKGYVSAEYITTRSWMEQVKIVAEDPLDIQTIDLEFSNVMRQGGANSLRGVLDSNIPITGVEVSVYDRRNMAEEMNVSVQFSRDEGVYAFDLYELDDELRFRRLTAGEKHITLTVFSTNDQQVILDRALYVTGECADAASITAECSLSATVGRADRIRDNRYSTAWQPEAAGDSLTVIAPADAETETLTLEWSKAPDVFEVVLDDQAYPMTNAAGMLRFNIKTGGARKMTVRVSNANAGILEARVYAKDRTPDVVQDWQPAGEKVDMMVLAAHPGDEFLYFGGAIPQAVTEGKNVLVVYMTDCGQDRMREALDALWSVGVRTYPVCLGLENKNARAYEDAVELWGLEETYKLLVDTLRRYHPDVVLTHDVEGEDNNQHKMTSATLRRAVLLAVDPEIYPESAEQYGVWDVKKTYIHRYEGNVLAFDPDAPVEALTGWTLREMTEMAFSKHRILMEDAELEDGEQYKPYSYGLIRSVIEAEDAEKLAFFENIDASDEETEAGAAE